MNEVFITYIASTMDVFIYRMNVFDGLQSFYNEVGAGNGGALSFLFSLVLLVQAVNKIKKLNKVFRFILIYSYLLSQIFLVYHFFMLR